MAKTKITHPRRRAILGIVAILLILIFANWLVKSTGIGNRTIDLTENNRHTLTEGTKTILGELNKPVIIRYYASRNTKLMPRPVKNYMSTVDSLLERYKKLADGNIRIEHLDPQPDTDAEDSARLDGISASPINNEILYFGLSISCLDQQISIPLLDPANETTLEYRLSSAIANVSNFKKQTLGLMTTLPLAGVPAQQPGEQAQQPWTIYQLLNQRYDLEPVSTSPEQLDPETMPVLLMIHPAGLSPKTEFLIDQYILKGGIVIACLDPFALTAPAGRPMMPGMPPVGGVAKFSTFPTLLKSWGIGMDAASVVADGKYATPIGNNQVLHGHLGLTKDAITSTNEIITRNFENLYFPLAGGFTIKGGGGISIETLVRTSNEVVFVSGMSATRPDPGLFARKRPTGKHYGLVMRLTGKFKTAFPEGDPSAKKEDAKDQPAALKRGQKEGIVYLIGDADFLVDRACFQQTPQGNLSNNNAALLQNILDQSMGSRHLIGSRSRTATKRPFTIITEMQTDHEQEIRDEVVKFQQRIGEIQAELQQILDTQGNSVVPTQAEEQKKEQLQTELIKLSRELRDKQKGLQARKDQLYSELTWMTVAITPTFIALVGLGVWLKRKRTTRAL